MLTAKRSLVSEVARGVGYDSDSSFIRAFRKRFGAAPSEYRRSAAVLPRPAAGRSCAPVAGPG
jgi:AraC-like DNA-binding protein